MSVKFTLANNTNMYLRDHCIDMNKETKKNISQYIIKVQIELLVGNSELRNWAEGARAKSEISRLKAVYSNKG